MLDVLEVFDVFEVPVGCTADWFGVDEEPVGVAAELAACSELSALANLASSLLTVC